MYLAERSSGRRKHSGFLNTTSENQPTVELVFQRTHPEDRALVQGIIDHAIQERTALDFEHRLLMPDGSIKYVRVVGHPAIAESGDIKFVGAITDVTDRKRAEALRDGESRMLEMIARDAPLEEILGSLVLVVEAQFAGLLCSVLLLDEDGQHARHGAAPSLPKSLCRGDQRSSHRTKGGIMRHRYVSQRTGCGH